MQRARGLVFRDRQRLLQQYGPGVETGVHLHDGDAGAGVPGEQRALYGRGAAPARQQRSVNVQAAPRQRVQALRPARSARRRRRRLPRHRPQLTAAATLSSRAAGCSTASPLACASSFTAEGWDLQAAAGGAIGLCQHERDLVTRIEQRSERTRGKFGRAGKDDLHGLVERGKCGVRPHYHRRPGADPAHGPASPSRPSARLALLLSQPGEDAALLEPRQIARRTPCPRGDPFRAGCIPPAALRPPACTARPRRSARGPLCAAARRTFS